VRKREKGRNEKIRKVRREEGKKGWNKKKMNRWMGGKRKIRSSGKEYRRKKEKKWQVAESGKQECREEERRKKKEEGVNKECRILGKEEIRKEERTQRWIWGTEEGQNADREEGGKDEGRRAWKEKGSKKEKKSGNEEGEKLLLRSISYANGIIISIQCHFCKDYTWKYMT
jgi:hypothetical protein